MSVTNDTRPRPGPGQVLVRTEAVGLCGSDVHAWRQDPGHEWVTTPVVLGHEAVGLFEDVADDVLMAAVLLHTRGYSVTSSARRRTGRCGWRWRRSWA